MTGPVRVRDGRELVFFTAYQNATGHEPWVTDGTRDGTMPLGDLFPGNGSSAAADFTDTGLGVVLFVATDGPSSHGFELWQSDGTPRGTQMVIDLLPGSGNSAPSRPAVDFDGTVYFGAVGLDGEGLWKWTPFGVTRVHHLREWIPRSIHDVTLFQRRIYFSARTSALGDELWVSDGTSAGTRLFADLNSGSQSSLPTSLSVAADRLFFAAFDPGLRRDVLCITDGVGVQRVANGAGTPTNPRRFRVSGYRVYFMATTGPGIELALFQSDGTIAGTHRVEDIRRGPQSSDILEFQLSDGKVYLSATDGVVGHESFVLRRTGANAESYGSPCAPAREQDDGPWPAPRLDVSTPGLGTLLRVDGTLVPQDHLAFLILGAPPRGPGLPLGSGCQVMVDLGLFAVADAFPTGTAATWQRQLPIPDDGMLIDAQLALWALYGPLVGEFAWQGTNAWLLTLGW